MADEKTHAEEDRQDTNQNQNQKNQNQNQNPPPAQPRRALDVFSRLPSAAMADEKAHGEQNRRDTNQNQNPRPALDAFFCWIAWAGLIFLAFNTAVAVYQARDYPWPVAFVVLSFLDLLLLFHFLRLLVAAPPNPNSNSPRRGCLRTAVWFLASFITVTLSYGLADMMLAVVWLAAALAVGLGFYWFFIYTPDSYFYPTDLKDDDICDML